MRVLLTVVSLLLAGCPSIHTNTPIKVLTTSGFQEDACWEMYCRNSEPSLAKKAGLKLVEVVAATRGINLDLGDGACEAHYADTGIDFRWARKSPQEVCLGE